MAKINLNLVVSDAVEATKFYEELFHGRLGEVYEFSNRKNSNEATVYVGDLALRLVDENAEFECFAPKLGQVSSFWLQIEVADVEATLEKALKLGATKVREISEFLGSKNTEIVDPYGYTWVLNQELTVLSFEEKYRIFDGYHEEIDSEEEK